MTDINIRDFTFSYLQAEYKRFANILHNYVLHIERIYNENHIPSSERNQYLKQINELIRDLSNIYNEKLKTMNNGTFIIDNDNTERDNKDNTEKNNKNTKLNKDNKEVKSKNNNNNSNSILKDLVKNIKTNNIQTNNNTEDVLDNNLVECIDIMKSLKVQCYNNLYINDFNEIKNKLLKLSTEIGFYNIDDAMNLIIGNSYKKILFINNEFDEYFNLINDIFVPVNYTKKNRLNKDIVKPTINSYLSSSDSENAIDNWFEISIVTDRLNLSFEGYYKYEPINILVRTSQICRHFIFSKKKRIRRIIKLCKIY